MRTAVSLCLKLFLLGVIPLFTLGFNVLEKTPLYSSLLSVKGVESALSERLTTQYGDAGKLVIEQDDSPEFQDLVRLIRKFSSARLPDSLPDVISRLGVDNGTSVRLAENNKLVVLIPESVPIYFLYGVRPKFPAQPVTVEAMIRIGSVGDVRAWLDHKRSGVRSLIDIMICIMSVILGLLIEFALPKTSALEPARPDAAMTGDPATSPAASKVTEGPPSVS